MMDEIFVELTDERLSKRAIIENLGRRNPVLSTVLHMAIQSEKDWIEALEIAVIALVNANESAHNAFVDYLRNNATPPIIR